MKKFEYRTIKMEPESTFYRQDLDDESLMEEMNVLGREGWELVTTLDNKVGGTSLSIVLIFKRILE